MKEITNLTDLLEVTTHAGELLKTLPWWRGEPVVYPTLLPKSHRMGLTPTNEMDLFHRFTQRARTRHPNCPDGNDVPAWLFLMQHYGLPTRLLDWTESVLIAAYFAVEKHPEEKAVLWALNPFFLNTEQIEINLVPTPNHKIVQQLFTNVYEGRESNSKIAAVLAGECDPRMMMQQSAFTIHGNDTPLDNLTDNEKFIMKFEIPIEAKRELRKALGLFGINRSYLFPDLENLASDLSEIAHYFNPSR